VYKRAEYKAIPCVILVVEGVVTYVGSPYNDFVAALEKSLEELVPANED